MVVLSRSTTALLVAFATLTSRSVLSEDSDTYNIASASSSPALLRASTNGVSALGGNGKSGGDVIPLAHHSSHSSKRYQRVGQIDTVIATITVDGVCPSNFTFSNNQCIQTGQSDIACPQGFTEEESAFPGATPEVIFRNRTCAMFALEIPPTVDCSSGALDGISCFEFESIAPDFVGCEPGFQLTAQGCVFEAVAPIGAPRCEVGELGPDNGCFNVEVFAATLVCDELAAFLGNDAQTCVTRTAAGPATTGCPDGFTLAADDQCTRTDTAGTVPSCDGLPGTLQGAQCVEFEAVAANLSCGAGFDLIENGCISFEDQAPQFVCPSGFTSVSALQCEREIQTPPIAQCSVYEAFFDAELQACVVVTQGPLPALECENGAIIQDGGCAFVEQAAATAFCADPDFVLANAPSGDSQLCQQCLSIGIVGGGVWLEDSLQGGGGHHGHRAHKHTVEEEQQEDTTTVTPTTAEEILSTNVRRLQTSDLEVTEDVGDEEDPSSSGQLPPTANSTTYRRDHHDGHHHGGGAGGDGTFDDVSGGGETFQCSSVAPAFQCQTGFVLSDEGIGQTCIQIEVAAGILVCASGFTLTSDQTACEARDIAPAVFSCETGFTLSSDSSQCSLTETATKDTECPPGSNLEGNMCLNVRITQAAILICGPGQELQGVECVAAAAVAAGFGCPEGFAFGEGDGTTCTRTTTQPGQQGCEAEGANLEEDQCFTYPGVPATATCGDGVLLAEGQCQSFELVAPALFCAAGFEQVDDTCVRQTVEFPNIECPEGSFVQNGGCVLASSIAAEATCPIGLVAVPIRDNTEFGCFELTAPSAICPFGQELTVGDECIITAIAPGSTPTLLPPQTGRSGHHGSGGHMHKNGGHNKAATANHH